jgi:hypothetical protein
MCELIPSIFSRKIKSQIFRIVPMVVVLVVVDSSSGTIVVWRGLLPRISVHDGMVDAMLGSDAAWQGLERVH